MDLLDLIITALVVVFAVSGFRRGITWVGPSLIGLLIGLVVGAAAAPPLARLVAGKGDYAPLAVTGFFLAVVLIIQGAGTALGFRARLRTLRTQFAHWDSWMGSAGAAVGVLVIGWYLGYVFHDSPWSDVDQQIGSSAIVRGLLTIAPRPPAFLTNVEHVLRNSEFPDPFSELAPSQPPPVDIPQLVDTPGIRTATHATSKVIAYGCGGAEAGSSWPIGNDHMVTNAHVVAGSNQVQVVTPDGATHAATVVLYDPDIDIAILDVPGVNLNALPMATDDPARGTTGAVIGYPGGLQEQVVPAAVRGTEQARGENIYNSDEVTRDIEVLSAHVIPGNSGGPMVDANGTVIGLVFAASVSTNDEGYALTMSQVGPAISDGRSRTTAVSTEGCT